MMSSFTSPIAGGAKVGSYGAAPVAATHPVAPVAAVGEAVPALASGTATQYWIELVAYPPGSTASLWLLVAGTWRHYDNPPAGMSQIVQEGFLGGATVRVWYDGAVVVGLVVSK
jgi:hypothetical protein